MTAPKGTRGAYVYKTKNNYYQNTLFHAFVENFDGKSLNGNVVVSAISIDVNVMFSLSNNSV